MNTHTLRTHLTAAAVLVLASALLLPFTSHAAERVDGFVCPVISTEAVLHSPKGAPLGDTGHYTIGGPDVAVPVFATNDDGAGVPPGPHAAPGDTTYTAIWAR